MEERHVFDLILKFHEDTILKVLGLQESFPVNRTIEESLKTEIPHEVFDVVLAEEILVEIMSKII